MATLEDIKAKMEAIQSERCDDAQLVSMQQFYQEMRRNGIAQKQQYTLPPISTSNVSVCQQQRFATGECE